LKYVDRVARRLADADPIRAEGQADITVEQMDATVAEFYQRSSAEEISITDLALDTDLVDIFNASNRRRKAVRPAADVLREHRKALVDKITYWTGAQRPLIKKLIEQIEVRVAELGLRADAARQVEHLTEFTVYATALAMNYVSRGRFVQP
jgi:hypothetical protein